MIPYDSGASLWQAIRFHVDVEYTARKSFALRQWYLLWVLRSEAELPIVIHTKEIIRDSCCRPAPAGSWCVKPVKQFHTPTMAPCGKAIRRAGGVYANAWAVWNSRRSVQAFAARHVICMEESGIRMPISNELYRFPEEE